MITAIEKYLKDREDEMFALLERLVSINSYSTNIEGVNKVVDVLQEVTHEMGFVTRRMPTEFTGDNLVAENRTRARNGGGPLLVGHMDTVFPPEMGFNTFRREADKAYGPGVTDMKGGLVIGIFVAKALMDCGYKDLPFGIFFNADEEIGSPHSRDLIVEEARKSDFCFVMEGSGMGGEVVTGRKGRIVFDLFVEGQPYHAGHCTFPKPSAIVEIAHKITALEALNNPEAGTSFNAGLIEGGVGPNTVAAKASARCETRFINPEIGETVWAAIEKITADSTLEGTSGSVSIRTHRPPMVTNDTILGLYSVVEEAADDIGMDIKQVFRGGGSDANTVSQAGIPVLDGMGPSGALFHTPEEYMLTDCMVKQGLLTAISCIKGVEKYS